MRPRVLLSVPRNELVTFFWDGRPDFYVGYRMFEHHPLTAGPAPSGPDRSPRCAWGETPSLGQPKLRDEDARPLLPHMRAAYAEQDPGRPVQLRFQAFTDGTAWCTGLDNLGAQERELFFEPVEDGVRMWMRLTTRADIAGCFAVAQCLQFAGETSLERMRPHSYAPAFSEFDYQAHWHPHQTLTCGRRDGRWLSFPVQHVAYHTPRGHAFAPSTPGPDVDHGLIIRESADGACAAGMYWERTAFVSNRHPADCVHSYVDFGPLAAGDSRTLHGAFYLVEGGRDALLSAWRRDFPIDNADAPDTRASGQ